MDDKTLEDRIKSLDSLPRGTATDFAKGFTNGIYSLFSNTAHPEYKSRFEMYGEIAGFTAVFSVGAGISSIAAYQMLVK